MRPRRAIAAYREACIEWFSGCSNHGGAIFTRPGFRSQASCQHSMSDITLGTSRSASAFPTSHPPSPRLSCRDCRMGSTTYHLGAARCHADQSTRASLRCPHPRPFRVVWLKFDGHPISRTSDFGQTNALYSRHCGVDPSATMIGEASRGHALAERTSRPRCSADVSSASPVMREANMAHAGVVRR